MAARTRDEVRAAMEKLHEAQAAYDTALRSLGDARRAAKTVETRPDAFDAVNDSKAALDAAEGNIRTAGRGLRDARERAKRPGRPE